MNERIFQFPSEEDVNFVKGSLRNANMPPEIIEDFLNFLHAIDQEKQLETDLLMASSQDMLTAALCTTVPPRFRDRSLGHFGQLAFALGYLKAKGLT